MICSNALRNGGTFLNFKLFIYSVTLVHSVYMALKLFNVDFGSSDDPMLQKYTTIKWKLLTAWFNVINLVYAAACVYCDWSELSRNADSKHVKMLNKVKRFTFASIIFPTTAFGDILFWRIWNHNRELMMPLSADKLVTVWDQHSMHTVSLIFILFELIFVNRRKPKNVTPQIFTMLTFITIYMFTCFISLQNEEYVYPCLRSFSNSKIIVLVLYTYISHLFYYTGQWVVVDLINNHRSVTKKLV